MKKMILIALMFAANIMFAQQPVNPQPKLSPKERKEKMEAMKVGFITQKLALTPVEAEKFWPLYNEFGQKRMDIRKKMFGDEKGKRMNIDSMTDQEAEMRVNNEMAFQEQMLSLKKEYKTKFETVLPVKKVAKLYQAEKEFRFKVGKRMAQNKNKNRMNNQKQMPPRNQKGNPNPPGGK